MRKFTEEHREKLRLAKLGTHMSEKTKEAIRKSNKFNKFGYIRGYSIDVHGYKIFSETNKFIKEHRLVMEKHLGRPLENNELIHHKDGNRLNNDISNLEVVSNSEHMKIHQRKKNRKHYDIDWLKSQIKHRTQRDIAKECEISESGLGNFIDRYINYPKCRTWAEYYKVRAFNK